MSTLELATSPAQTSVGESLTMHGQWWPGSMPAGGRLPVGTVSSGFFSVEERQKSHVETIGAVGATARPPRR
jgi:hypothetical protein